MTEDSIAYELLIPRITEFLQYEARLYKVSGIILLAIGFIILWIFPAGGGAFLLGAAYMFFLAWKNQKRVPTLFTGTILEKRHWYHEQFQEDGGSPTISHHREFVMQLHQSRKLKPGTPSRQVTRMPGRSVVVDESIYNTFAEQEEFNFILSAANELIGYLQHGEFHLMEKIARVKGNQERRFSVAISQAEKSQQRNWELR